MIKLKRRMLKLLADLVDRVPEGEVASFAVTFQEGGEDKTAMVSVNEYHEVTLNVKLKP